MSLTKKSSLPSLMNGNWLSNFVDNDRFFDSERLRDKIFPAVNVKEGEKNFEIELAAPGLSKKDFKVTAENGILTISSEKTQEDEKKEKDYTRREFSYSSFSRSFLLPDNANDADVTATYEDGVLRLRLGKKALTSSKSQKAIEVK
jgi:HSP20 family protein